MIAWMKRHERTIIVFGALLFIGTFLIKDVVGEYVKDLATSIADTERSFRSREEFFELRKQIRDFYDDFDVRTTTKKRESPYAAAHRTIIALDELSAWSMAPKSSIERYEFQYLQLRRPLDEQIKNIDELLEYVALPKELNDQFQKDKKEVDALRDKVKELDQQEKVIRADSNSKYYYDYTLTGMADVQIELDEIETRVTKLAPTLVDFAKAKEHKDEALYTVCKAVNGLCFVLGIALALVGKFYRFEVFGGPG